MVRALGPTFHPIDLLTSLSTLHCLIVTNLAHNFTLTRLLSIGAHLGVIILHNKTIQRSDFYIIGVALFLYFLSPTWLTVRLARLVFAAAVALIPNVLVCRASTEPPSSASTFIPSFWPCTDLFLGL